MKNMIIKNMHEKFSWLPSHVSNITVDTIGSLTIINSHLTTTDMFNIIYADIDATPTAAETSQAVERFTAEEQPFAFWLTSDQETQLSGILQQCHLTCHEQEWLMCVDLNNDESPNVKLHDGLQIKMVDCKEHLNDWTEVFHRLLPSESTDIETYYQWCYPTLQRFNHKIKCYVGYLNKQPVATGALFFSDQIAGIFDIATIPSAQRQGIATTVIQYILNEAKIAGFNQVSLSASLQGRHVYKRLGFTTYGQFKVYNPALSRSNTE